MRVLLIAISLFTLISCDNYQKVLKKGTREEKLAAAKKYYGKEDFVKAQPLLEELIGLYFGDTEREDIYYMYASTHFALKEYYLAGYHFKNFAQTYPLSERREEAYYRAAICEYYKSLSFELDQSNTKVAINSLQAFINRYPNSEYVEDCNNVMDDLRSRLLKKVYESAILWYELGEYKAAMVACSNALEDYPDMINRDELTYIIADAAYIYADNSIEKYKLDRFEQAREAANNYLKEYKKGNKYYKDVIKIRLKINEALASLENLSQNK